MGRDRRWIDRQHQIVEGLINHFQELGKRLGQKNLRRHYGLEANRKQFMGVKWGWR